MERCRPAPPEIKSLTPNCAPGLPLGDLCSALCGWGCEGSATGVWGPWGSLVVCCSRCSHLGGWRGSSAFRSCRDLLRHLTALKWLMANPAAPLMGSAAVKLSWHFVGEACLQRSRWKGSPCSLPACAAGDWGCAGAVLGALGVAGRERTAHHMRGSERLPWLAPRFPDDKQLRERDLQQIKSEGKVHYLPRGAPARRPVAGGRAFWLVEPILIIPGGSALLPGLQGGTGGMELGPGWEGTHQGLGFLSHWHLRGCASASRSSSRLSLASGSTWDLSQSLLWGRRAPAGVPKEWHQGNGAGEGHRSHCSQVPGSSESVTQSCSWLMSRSHV